MRGLQLSSDGRTLTLDVDAEAGFVHQIDLSQLLSQQGLTPEGATAYYQAIKLPE